MGQKVFLINDTEDVYHWGCNGTSVQIKEQLTRMGVERIFYVARLYTSTDASYPRKSK